MYISNLFGEIPERSATFVISANADKRIHQLVKDHLIETLSDCAQEQSDFKFNIILYNDEVLPWSDKMVECSAVSINMAARWLREVDCKRGNDLFFALKTAFSDPESEAVYLVTNSLPVQDQNDIFEHVNVWKKNRPLHCISVVFHEEDVTRSQNEFMNTLAIETKGSFHVAVLSEQGRLEKVKKIYNSIYTPITGTKVCSIETSLQNSQFHPELTDIPPAFETYNNWFSWWPYSSLHVYNTRKYLAETPVASIVSCGTRVLARREQDGYYYLGTIAQEVDKHQTQFLMEYDRINRGTDLRMQQTALHDIIAYYDAKRHSVMTGDKVLAPWNHSNKGRYGPGQVLRGIEQRSNPDEQGYVTITFWNGKTETINKGVAIWIPEELYERIVLELQMPSSTRKQKTTSTTISNSLQDVEAQDYLWPLGLSQLYFPRPYRGLFYIPTYPLIPQLAAYYRGFPHYPYYPLDEPLHLLYPKELLPKRRRYPVREERIADSKVTADQLHNLVDQQLSLDKHKTSTSSSSSSSSSSNSSSSSSDSDDEDLKMTVDKCVGTERSRSKQKHGRPEWKKYWPQSPQPRLHHQPEFQRNDQTLYSTWKEPSFGSNGGVNNNALYEQVGYGVTSDRAALLAHLRNPYSKRPSTAPYNDLQGMHTLMHSQDVHDYKAQRTADFKRSKHLQRLGSDYEKQQSYEDKIKNTINAKSKMNQAFRDKFYNKEIEALERQTQHQSWLHDKQNKSAQRFYERGDEKLVAFERGRQQRQQQHNYETARQLQQSENYNAALNARKQNAKLQRRENRLAMERALHN